MAQPIAASSGINTTAFLGVAQSKLLFRVNTWTGEFIRPVALALIVSLPVGWYFAPGSPLSPPWNFVLALAFLLIAILLIVRYGMSRQDALALGALGKLAGNKGK